MDAMVKTKFILWGTGNWAKKCYRDITALLEDRYEIVSFCDNDQNKWGRLFFEREIVSPEGLKNTDFDMLIIANHFYEEIVDEIKHLKLCDPGKVYSVDDLNRYIYAKKQYLFLEDRIKEKKTIRKGKINKLTVYTALIGNSYSLKDPHFISDDITYICFTDNKDIKSDVWNMEYVSDKEEGVMLARKIKIRPWDYLETKDPVCWIDTKFEVFEDLRDCINLYWKKTGLLCFPHYERKCICDETGAIIPYKPDIKREVIEQTAMYLKDGYPSNNGLYDTGCLVRDLSDEKVRSIMDSWWRELKKHTYRDQISFPYILWKNNYFPDIADVFTNHNKWFRLNVE